jgi:GMP synthase-like glutamine amidotransferase
MIVVLDFGSQYTQLIARRIRESKVYCEIHPFNVPLEKIKALNPKGIILSGGPASVYQNDAPRVDTELFVLPVPFLGICVGLRRAPIIESMDRPSWSSTTTATCFTASPTLPRRECG